MNNQMRVVDHGQGGAPNIMTIKSDAPIPTLKNHEVLIEVEVAGVNRPDVFQRMGLYPPPPNASPYLGLEVAGKVVALGSDVRNLKIGEMVCALTPGGAYAEFCAAPAKHCLPIPQGLSMQQAAALPETYFTVWSNLMDMGHIREGESLLVHGGSSGIGLTAIQIAKAFGLKVFTTVGNQAKVEACQAAGADVVINYKEQDFEEVVLKVTNKLGVDVILDIVGGSYIQKNLNCLALDGRLLQVAF
jgi:putative PIG3 family NAD(P)H quinone oxidoreductase